MNPARRRFFLRARPDHAKPRLPWLDSPRFLEQCTACGACAGACPEGIVTKGSGGLPAIDFARGGCSFCGQCAEACPEGLFTAHPGAAWPHRVAIGESCITSQGVVCESCRDVCEPRAITFAPRLGGVATPQLDETLCTACGACTAVCPVDAIGWTRRVHTATRTGVPADAR